MVEYNFSLKEARKRAREINGTYRKCAENRFDYERRVWLDEPSYCVMDWQQFHIWKNQK